MATPRHLSRGRSSDGVQQRRWHGGAKSRTSSTRRGESGSNRARGLSSGSGAALRLKQHLVSSAPWLPDTLSWLLIKAACLRISSPGGNRPTGFLAALPIRCGRGGPQCGRNPGSRK
ncbi:hypothetical protein SKAU_G00324000 [Synaphobranchus kaupii]|uniref:Uncharacterized protein n=1 Tax=Synaphobranchus kaupii TaxID=118154 RepID=A0A9Q1EPE2_SYNKA|nr:hypothetical protein SKAU_G00324000 [Synaphobranchus kaupii]